MTTILSHDDFYIVNNKRTPNVYSICLNCPNEPLLKSVAKIILGASITSDFKRVQFKAFTIKTFEQFKQEQRSQNGSKNLRIHTIAKIFMNLATQLKYVITNHQQSFIGYSPENIFVLDDNKFVYISIQHLSNIRNQEIELTFPFSQSDFYLSPEQRKITELPSSIHFKTAYFSLACLLLESLLPDTETDYEENKFNKLTPEFWMHKLDNSFIQNTLLHGFLKRCLVEEPKERSFLFI